MENESRIKHFSPSDLGYISEFRELQEKISHSLFDFLDPGAIDLIELYNVCLFFEDIDELKEEPRAFLMENKEIEKRARKALSLHFKDIDESGIRRDLECLQEANSKGFWRYSANDYLEAMLRFENVRDISDGGLRALFEYLSLEDVVRNKEFALRLGKEIKEAVLKDPRMIELLIAAHDSADSAGKYHLPHFGEEEINDLVLAYCGRPDRNPSCLESLLKHKNGKDSYVLKPTTRTVIEKSLDDFWETVKNNPEYAADMMKTSIRIEVVDGLDFPIIHQFDEGELKIKFSSDIIKNAKSPLEAFEAAATHASLTDLSGCCTLLPYNPHKKNGLSDLFDRPQKDGYGNGAYRDYSFLQERKFLCLAENFERKGISLYEGCRQYVDSRINPLIEPSKLVLREITANTYFEKCSTLLIQIEGVLSLHRVYVEEGEIGEELIEAKLPSIKLGDYPSLIEDKYYSFNSKSEEAEIIRKLLFSDQSRINRVGGALRANFFAKLIEDFKVQKNSYEGVLRQRVEFLIVKGIVAEEAERLQFANRDIRYIWGQFQHNRFVPSYILSPEQKAVLDKYAERGWCDRYSSLFSHEEADFLDYWLNDSKFSNSIGLRNEYAHGKAIRKSEDKCKEDYFMALRIMMICLCKIHWDIEKGKALKPR